LILEKETVKASHSFTMQALLDKIKDLNCLMLPYLKPDTYQELMGITHDIIALFNEKDTYDTTNKKIQELFEKMQHNCATYKSQLEDAQSKIRSMECDMTIMRGELEMLRRIKQTSTTP
jgi:hypothetical protein